MREIKFRAKTTFDGKWVYGDLFRHPAGAFIIYHDSDRGWNQHKIDLATVGQFTGIKDKNGVEVYFGDICKYHDDSGTKQTGVVTSYEYFSGYIEAFGGDDEGNQDIELHPDYEIEVIGNIFQSPHHLGEIKLD